MINTGSEKKDRAAVRVASEISRNEISRNVSRNFYFAFREIL
jgi:hypothetical protein